MEYLEIDLTAGTMSLHPDGGMRGLALAIDLYNGCNQDAIVIASPSSEAIENAGSAAFSIVFTSPITEKISFAYSNLPMGYSLYKLGLSALVIRGKIHRLSYVSLYQGQFEVIAAEGLKGATSTEFEKIVRSVQDSALSTSRAADNGIKFSTLQGQGKTVSAPGLGYAFHERGLKGIVAQGFAKVDVVKNASKWSRRVEKSAFARRIRKQGACCFVEDALRLGWLPVRYYSDRFDPRAYSLSSKNFVEIYGNYPDSCQDCFLACGRRKKDNSVLPTWQDVMMLGTNLGIFAPEKVIKLSSAAFEQGLDSTHLGALLSYASTLEDTELEMLGIKDLSIESYLKLIYLIGENRGSGALFQEGLKTFPKAIQSDRGEAISADLRGNYEAAILSSMSLPIFLPAGAVLPKFPMNPECAAILALYELIYVLALLEYGYRPFSAAALYWSRIPEIAYHVPFLMRMFCRGFTLYGHKMKELLPKGLELFDKLKLEMEDIPEYFEMEPRSAIDNRTVPMRKLKEYFYSEKFKVETMVKSIREKMVKPSSDSNAAVGPSEDLGLDADPGLSK